MRLWHYKLIPYLPKNQLCGQWRECCCIAKNISENGTPNHILVNKIMNYPMEHFYHYGYIVFKEMKARNYKVDWNKFDKWFSKIWTTEEYDISLFPRWHNDRYLKQCLYNLQEKADCGGISESTWQKIHYEFMWEL